MTDEEELLAAFLVFREAKEHVTFTQGRRVESELGLDEAAHVVAARARLEDCLANLVAWLVRVTGCTELEAMQAIIENPNATLEELVVAVHPAEEVIRPR